MNVRRIAIAAVVSAIGWNFLPDLLESMGVSRGDGSISSPNYIATTLIVAVVLSKLL